MATISVTTTVTETSEVISPEDQRSISNALDKVEEIWVTLPEIDGPLKATRKLMEALATELLINQLNKNESKQSALTNDAAALVQNARESRSRIGWLMDAIYVRESSLGLREGLLACREDALARREQLIVLMSGSSVSGN
ncbi:hypothetical protein DFH27DRAFT_605906 [Peziza echinospora]|nr:hypothetical protein DFH27DRAFT_605906 [Peziza echinospora]